MAKNTNDLISNMINKSIEAFLLALEIYNKPTIKYRLEGFSFFICNAWELILKAELIKRHGEASIYYKDNNSKTISLKECIKKIFTNDKDPLRQNLEIIIGLRDTSTHYIIEELEITYYPFLQSCVMNYNDKLYDFFNIDVTNSINSAFLSLVIGSKEISEQEILSKHGQKTLDYFDKIRKINDTKLEENRNPKFAININLNAKIVKDSNKADIKTHIAKDGEKPVFLLKEIKDTNSYFPYTQKSAITKIKRRLKKNKIKTTVIEEINQYVFQLYIREFKIRENEALCYIHTQTKNNTKTYSNKFIEEMVKFVMDNQDNSIKEVLKKKVDLKEQRILI